MNIFVIDASVIIKWIFPDRPKENHISQALNVLLCIKQGAIKVLQPPHWLAEAAAVITRFQPKIAENAINLLHALEFPITDSIESYQIAYQLSKSTNHHLFDTLYHAVALSHGATFLTADETYYKKAHKKGFILRLSDFHIYDN